MVFPVKINIFQTTDSVSYISKMVQFSETRITEQSKNSQPQNAPLQATKTIPFYNTVNVVKNNVLGIINIFSYIWLSGCLIILAFNIFRYSIFLQIIHKNSVKVILPELSLNKIIARKTDMIKAPLMIGLFRTTLLLPNLEISPQNLNYILLHELTHYRRRDLLYKWFVMIVCTIHWFNPLVYIVSKQIDEESEISCDLSVVANMSNQEKKEYMHTILSFATQTEVKTKLLTTSMASNKKVIKRRVIMIKNLKKINKATIIISLIVMLIIVIVSILVSGIFANNIYFSNNNKLLTKLGYTKELITEVLDNKTIFSEDNKNIDKIVKSLPLQSYRSYISFSLQTEPSKEINIIYEIDDSYNRGGNGIDSFPEIVKTNNALLLFASIEGLDKVNFLSYDKEELNRAESCTTADLSSRFGNIEPLDMDLLDLYKAMGANIQISEFYFAHYSRIYLGSDPEKVSYRNGEPAEIRQQPDGSTIWIYPDFGKVYSISPDDSETDPENTAIYYFNSAVAEKNDNLIGLYATRFIHGDNYGKTYEDIEEVLGLPSIIKNMGKGDKYIAYSLAEGQQKNAYFVLHKNKVIEEGVMYGNNYTILNFK